MTGWRGGTRCGRFVDQLFDPIDHRGIEARQRAWFNVKAPLLDAFNQFRALKAQFFRQLVDTDGQRQLLLGGAPAMEAGLARSVGIMHGSDRSDQGQILPEVLPGLPQEVPGGITGGELEWSTRPGRGGDSPSRHIMVVAFPDLFPRVVSPSKVPSTTIREWHGPSRPEPRRTRETWSQPPPPLESFFPSTTARNMAREILSTRRGGKGH